MNTLLSIWTVLVLIIFLGIVIWACGSKTGADFDAAARIPINDDDHVRDDSGADQNG